MTEVPVHRSYQPAVTRRTFVTLDPIVERQRLIVGDLLELHGESETVRGDSVLLRSRS